MAGSGSASAITRMREPDRVAAASRALLPLSASSTSWRGSNATEATKPSKAATAKASERWATTTSDAMITATATISQSEDQSLAPSSRRPRIKALPTLAGRLALSVEAARPAWSVNACAPRRSESFQEELSIIALGLSRFCDGVPELQWQSHDKRLTDYSACRHSSPNFGDFQDYDEVKRGFGSSLPGQGQR